MPSEMISWPCWADSGAAAFAHPSSNPSLPPNPAKPRAAAGARSLCRALAPACQDTKIPVLLLLALILKQCLVHTGNALQRPSPVWCWGPKCLMNSSPRAVDVLCRLQPGHTNLWRQQEHLSCLQERLLRICNV